LGRNREVLQRLEIPHQQRHLTRALYGYCAPSAGTYVDSSANHSKVLETMARPTSGSVSSGPRSGRPVMGLAPRGLAFGGMQRARPSAVGITGRPVSFKPSGTVNVGSNAPRPSMPASASNGSTAAGVAGIDTPRGGGPGSGQLPGRPMNAIDRSTAAAVQQQGLAAAPRPMPMPRPGIQGPPGPGPRPVTAPLPHSMPRPGAVGAWHAGAGSEGRPRVPISTLGVRGLPGAGALHGGARPRPVGLSALPKPPPIATQPLSQPRAVAQNGSAMPRASADDDRTPRLA